MGDGMKVVGDFISVNLATGNKTREITGDGEKKLETVTTEPKCTPKGETPCR